MSAENQDFTVDQNCDYTVTFDCYNSIKRKFYLSGMQLLWTINTPSPIIKSDGVTNGSQVSFSLSSKDTSLIGVFSHSLVAIDGFGKRTNLSKGNMTIE